MSHREDYRALTALKGLFILIIAVHNTLSCEPLFTNIPGTAFLILFGGSLGNSMFFLLSGFLLSVGYKERIHNHTVPFQKYLLRRLKKLYPMYILSNLVSLIIELIRYGVSAINIEKIIYTVLLQAGGGIGSYSPYNSPTWFLSALFVCYILFFGICYYAKNPMQYLSWISAFVLLGHILMAQNMEVSFLRASNGIAYMNFFLGCILAEVYPIISRKLHNWLQPLFFVVLPLLLYLMLSFGVEIIAGDVRVCFAFVVCPMILYLALVKGPCSRILQMKCFVFLGNISSSIFFWHMVTYFVFCDIYAWITQGSSVQEPQYLVYFIGLLLISWIFTKLDSKIRLLKKPAKPAV